MTDWSKLKVADLKEELKKRGLLQTGLKAALVERLVAAENGNASESDATLQGDASKLDGDSATSPDDVSPILPTPSDILPDSKPETTTETEEPSPQPAVEDLESLVVEQPDADAAINEVQATSTSQPESILETPDASQPTHTVESSQPPSTDVHHSALPSIEPREAIEDRQKRKRRSQSPAPSASDVAHKRLRVSDAENAMDGIVQTSASDTEWVEKHNGVDAAEVNAEAKEVAPAGEGVEAGPTIVGTSMDEVKVQSVNSEPEGNASSPAKAEAMSIDIPTPTKEEDRSVAYDDSPSRIRDSRFKTLFSTEGARTRPLSRDANEDVEPDRIIGPAVHPATSALYISRLMRPINPAQFQAHLAVLAAPPDRKSEDPEAIIKFYVDPVRTHAFVSFTTVAAAARVRSALHDRIWPDEKTRKPLWVDFVPADMVVEWIDQEQKSNPGGRGMGKKWEVYYEIEQGRQVTTTLQEVNSATFAHPTHPQRQPSISNSRDSAPMDRSFDAPSGPRTFKPVPPSTNRLNELFKSTTATPVLYWQPVSRDLADKRFDSIDRALSKDAAAGRRIDGEQHRYSFQDDDVLVDRGPEIFSGIRPPRDMRGPRRDGGGYRGRYQGRGGYRGGDSFRPNGDRGGNGYRDRRDGHGRR